MPEPLFPIYPLTRSVFGPMTSKANPRKIPPPISLSNLPSVIVMASMANVAALPRRAGIRHKGTARPRDVISWQFLQHGYPTSCRLVPSWRFLQFAYTGTVGRKGREVASGIPRYGISEAGRQPGYTVLGDPQCRVSPGTQLLQPATSQRLAYPGAGFFYGSRGHQSEAIGC